MALLPKVLSLGFFSVLLEEEMPAGGVEDIQRE